MVPQAIFRDLPARPSCRDLLIFRRMTIEAAGLPSVCAEFAVTEWEASQAVDRVRLFLFVMVPIENGTRDRRERAVSLFIAIQRFDHLYRLANDAYHQSSQPQHTVRTRFDANRELKTTVTVSSGKPCMGYLRTAAQIAARVDGLRRDLLDLGWQESWPITDLLPTAAPVCESGGAGE